MRKRAYQAGVTDSLFVLQSETGENDPPIGYLQKQLAFSGRRCDAGQCHEPALFILTQINANGKEKHLKLCIEHFKTKKQDILKTVSK